MHTLNRIGFVVAVLGLTSAAYATDPTPTGTPTGTPGTNEPTTMPEAEPMPDGSGAKPTANPNQGQVGQSMDDGQVVGILNAISTSEVEQAKYVIGKTKNAEVKRYAQSLVDDHMALQQKTATWSKSAGIKAADSRAQADYVSSAKSGLTRLNSLTGEELDRQYLQHSVMTHQKTLDLIDTQITTSVDDPALKTLLRDTRPKLQRHLEMAQSLRTSLGGGQQPGTDAPPSTPADPDMTPTPTPTPNPNPNPNPSPNPSGK